MDSIRTNAFETYLYRFRKNESVVYFRSGPRWNELIVEWTFLFSFQFYPFSVEQIHVPNLIAFVSIACDVRNVNIYVR